jgi:hypothetical protein
MLEGSAVVCTPDGVHPQGAGYTAAQITPYRQTLFFDASSGATALIRDPADCTRATRRFAAGPGRFAVR